MNHLRCRAILIIFVFLGLLSIPWLNGRFKFLLDLPSLENRQLASEPEFKVDYLDPFPAKYETFYNDNFPFRSRLIKYYSHFQLRFFQTSPNPARAILGKDDWFFMGGKEQDSYLGNFDFAPFELEAFQKELEYRSNYIASLGGKFYFMVTPSKNNIYPEMMPYSQKPKHDKCWGEQLLSYLEQHSEVKTINPYSALRKDHLKQITYHKLDNHWTARGGFYAANEAFRKIHKDFPDVDTLSLTDYNISTRIYDGGNIVRMFGMEGEYQDTILQFFPKTGKKSYVVPNCPYPITPGFPYPDVFEMAREMEDTSKPSMLLITDSFGYDIFPFFSERFHRTLKIFDNWEYKLNEDILKSEMPDVVVLLVLEGNLRNILDHQARLMLQE